MGKKMKKDCSYCKHLVPCDNQNKSSGYFCSSFTSFRSVSNENPLDFLINLSNKKETKEKNLVLSNGLSIDIDQSGDIVPSSSFSIASMVREVVSSTSIVPKDVRIDDGDLPLAKNFYDWFTNDELCAGLTTPFLEQLMIATKLFSEYCPRCSDTRWMEIDNHNVDDSIEKFLSKVSLLENGVCPSCKSKRSELVKSGDLIFYRELAANCGQRSGKSQLVAMLSSYITHRLLKMQKPNSIYSLPANNILHGTFVALTYAQAKDTLWEPLFGYITESKWFQNYHQMLKHYEEKYGRDLLKFNDTFVMYRPRSTLIYPAGPDKRVLRGKTRIFGCVHPDTKILTPDSYIPIKKLEVGDFILQGNCVYSIKRHGVTGTKQIWKITTALGHELYCSKDHEILVYCDGLYLKKKVKDIDIHKDKAVLNLGERRKRIRERIYDFSLTYAKLSALICFSTEKVATKTVEFSAKDTIINRILKCFVDLKIKFRQKSPTSLTIEFIDYYKIKPKLDVTRYLYYKDISKGEQKAFLRTFLTSEEFIYTKYSKDIQLLALSFGIIVHRKEDLLRLDTLNKQIVEDYDDCCVDRYRLYTVMGDKFTCRFSSIEEIDEAIEMYDMEINNASHTYVANGFIVSNSCDELGWFDNSKGNTKVKMNAKEIYIALERSLLTVRTKAARLIASGYDETLTAYFLNISSPSSQQDMICELVRQSKVTKSLLGVHLPTWKMNPDVPREALQEEFDKDPVAAMRDYGAEPPITSSPFNTSQSQLEECYMKGKPNACRIEYRQETRKDGTKTLWAKAKVKKFTKKSVLAIDAGRVNNSFACSVGHLDSEGFPIIDILIEVIPVPGVEINFSYTYLELITPLIEKRNVTVMLADRWNSDKILDDAQSEFDITTGKYSLKYSDMYAVKMAIMDGDLVLPKPEPIKLKSGKRKIPSVSKILQYQQNDYPLCFKKKPIHHFVVQCMTVVDTGKQVLKGDGDLTDDMWRAMCLCYYGLNSGVYEEELKGEVVVENVRSSVLGAASLASGGKAGQMSSSNTSKVLGKVVSCK